MLWGAPKSSSAIAELARAFSFPLVVDPVMFSKHGARLMSSEAETVLRDALLPACTLVTPNIAEAEALSGATITTVSDMEQAATTIARLGPKVVLLKGGHLEGEPVDVLYSAGTSRRFMGRRVDRKTPRHWLHLLGGYNSIARPRRTSGNGRLTREAVRSKCHRIGAGPWPGIRAD